MGSGEGVGGAFPAPGTAPRCGSCAAPLLVLIGPVPALGAASELAPAHGCGPCAAPAPGHRVQAPWPGCGPHVVPSSTPGSPAHSQFHTRVPTLSPPPDQGPPRAHPLTWVPFILPEPSPALAPSPRRPQLRCVVPTLSPAPAPAPSCPHLPSHVTVSSTLFPLPSGITGTTCTMATLSTPSARGRGVRAGPAPPGPPPRSPALTDDVELGGEGAVAVQDAARGLSRGRLALHQCQGLAGGGRGSIRGSIRGSCRGSCCGSHCCSHCGIFYGFSCAPSCGCHHVPSRVPSRVPSCHRACRGPRQRSGWGRAGRDRAVPSQDPRDVARPPLPHGGSTHLQPRFPPQPWGPRCPAHPQLGTRRRGAGALWRRHQGP